MKTYTVLAFDGGGGSENTFSSPFVSVRLTPMHEG